MIHLLINLIRILLRLIPVIVILIALYRNPGHLRLKKAGYKEKDVTVGDVRFHYAESSDTEKPVMVLLHGEMMDWFSYHRVMTALCDTYHVYVPDLPGHGKTRCPDDYEMNAGNIGSSLAKFIEEVIGRPVIICGNSAGGLLAVWLAANKPDAVIHCAAWTAVDMAEDDDKVTKVRAINAGGTQNIADVCKRRNAVCYESRNTLMVNEALYDKVTLCT